MRYWPLTPKPALEEKKHATLPSPFKKHWQEAEEGTEKQLQNVLHNTQTQ